LLTGWCQYEAGLIESDKLYDNLMNKFLWGGMNNPKVYLDDFHVRTISVVRVRTRFIQLANELINQGDTAKAKRVLDRCIELTPNKKIPFDHTIIQVANAYYKCNEFEKGNLLVSELGEMCNERLSYYLDQKQSFIAAINEEIMYNFQVLQNLVNVSKGFNQTLVSNKLDSLSNQQYSVYSAKVSGL
jgi:hypothetical protein